MFGNPTLSKEETLPNLVGSGFEGVFSSTVEEERRMRVLCGKDAVGVGGNSGGEPEGEG